jgi:CheY-like chemotaxis protein
MIVETILVIDDDPGFQVLVQGLIKSLGYQAISALTAGEGLDAVRRFRPRAILVDIRLPGQGIDGWEVARRIKEDPVLKDIPVIIVSASGISSEEKKTVTLGCEGYIQKPFSVQVFKDALIQFLAPETA